MIYEMTDYIVLWNDPPENPPLRTDETTLMKFFNLSADLILTIEGYLEITSKDSWATPPSKNTRRLKSLALGYTTTANG